MKVHYFEDKKPDDDDIQLKMAVGQGYVPPTCLLGGMTAMCSVYIGKDPCAECNGPRERCGGRPKKRD